MYFRLLGSLRDDNTPMDPAQFFALSAHGGGRRPRPSPSQCVPEGHRRCRVKDEGDEQSDGRGTKKRPKREDGAAVKAVKPRHASVVKNASLDASDEENRSQMSSAAL